MGQIVNVRQHLNSQGEPKVARRTSTLWPGLIVAFLVLVLSAGARAQETQVADVSVSATIDRTEVVHPGVVRITATVANNRSGPVTDLAFHLVGFDPEMDFLLYTLKSATITSGTTTTDAGKYVTVFGALIQFYNLPDLGPGQTINFNIVLEPPVGLSQITVTSSINININEVTFNVNSTEPSPSDLKIAAHAYTLNGGYRGGERWLLDRWYGLVPYEGAIGGHIPWHTFQPIQFETTITSEDAVESVEIENAIAGAFNIDSVTMEVTSGTATGINQDGTSLTIENLGADSTVKIVMTGSTEVAGVLTNYVNCDWVKAGGEVAGNETQTSVEIQYTESTDLAILVTPVDNAVNVGDECIFNVIMTNNGPHSISSAKLGLGYNTLFYWDFVSIEKDGVVSDLSDMISLDPGESASFAITLKALKVGLQDFTVNADPDLDYGGYFDPDKTNNTAVASVDVNGPKYDLQANLKVSPAKIQRGGLVVLTMSVLNNGPDDATSITLENIYGYYPFDNSYLELYSVEDAGQWNIIKPRPHLLAKLPELKAGESATITIVTVLAYYKADSGDYKHSFVVSTPIGDTNPENDRATAFTPVTTEADPGADLLITAATPAPGVLNQNLTYNVRALNLGPDPTSSAYIGNILPNGVMLSSASSDRGNVQVNGKYVDVSGVALGVGEAATLTLNVVPTQTGVITNQSGLTSPDFDSNLGNNISVLDTLVTETVPEPDPDTEIPDTEIPVCSEAVDLSAGIDKLKLKGKYKKKKAEWQFKVNARVLVGNTGVECSPPTNVFLYLSDDPVLDASDALLATKTVKKVCPGKKPKKAKFKLKLDEAQNPYGRYLIAVADGDNIVVECNEANNAGTGF